MKNGTINELSNDEVLTNIKTKLTQDIGIFQITQFNKGQYVNFNEWIIKKSEEYENNKKRGDIKSFSNSSVNSSFNSMEVNTLLDLNKKSIFIFKNRCN